VLSQARAELDKAETEPFSRVNPSMLKRLKPDQRRGIAAVEFAIILPIMLLLLLGVFEIGRMINVRQTLVSAAREAGRQAAAGRPDDELPEVVFDVLSRTDVATGNIQVNLDSEAILPDGNDAYILTVSVPVADVAWSLSGLFTADVITVRSTWPRS
jgi:Flp pilus assembly protein TadG